MAAFTKTLTEHFGFTDTVAARMEYLTTNDAQVRSARNSDGVGFGPALGDLWGALPRAIMSNANGIDQSNDAWLDWLNNNTDPANGRTRNDLMHTWLRYLADPGAGDKADIGAFGLAYQDMMRRWAINSFVVP